jgi:hypothetical protein
MENPCLPIIGTSPSIFTWDKKTSSFDEVEKKWRKG